MPWSFDSRVESIVASSKKKVWWLFEVDSTYFWSTRTVPSSVYNAQAYSFKVIPSSFKGIEINRSRAEQGVVAPSKLKFTIHNKNNALSASTFEKSEVIVRCIMDDGTDDPQEVITHAFTVTKEPHAYEEKLHFECEDILQQYLDGVWPNTKYVNALSPMDTQQAEDGLCVPKVYGTAYIPVRPIYNVDHMYYVLGESGPTYTIDEVRSPPSTPKSVWQDSSKYPMDQSTKTIDSTGYRVFQPMIFDTGDPGLFKNGTQFLDILCKYSRSDTVSMTNPADIIEDILLDFGVPSGDIRSSTFTSAASTFTSWGLSWNGGFYEKRNRRQLLSLLLIMCNSVLRVTDKIELHPLSKTAQETIDASVVLRASSTKGVKKTTFKSSRVTPNEMDSGYVSWSVSGEPQILKQTTLVPAKGSTVNSPSSESLDLFMVHDTQDVQRLGTLYFQRKLMMERNNSFSSKASLIGSQPDDVVQIDEAKYGGTYDTLTDKITIRKNLILDFSVVKYSVALDDFTDLTPSSITPATNDASVVWTGVYSGPQSTPDSGDGPNVLPGQVVMSADVNRIILDPETPIIRLDQGGTDRVLIGDLGTGNYGLRVNDNSGNMVMQVDTTQAVVGGFTINNTEGLYAGTGATRVQMKPGAGFWAGGTTRGTAPFRVTEAGVLTATSANITGTITASAGAIGGWTIGSTTITTTGLSLDSGNNRIRAYTGGNYVDMTASGLVGYDTVLGTTFTIPTDGSAPEFSSGIIKECVYEIYTSGVIRTDADPASNGGLLINNTEIKGYNSSGALTYQVVYDGASQGYFYSGDAANEYLKFDPAGGVGISTAQPTAISILGGGDISLTGDDSNPGKIIWSGTYSIEFYANTQGSQLYLFPQTDMGTAFSIGSGVSNNFTSIKGYVKDDGGMISNVLFQAIEESMAVERYASINIMGSGNLISDNAEVIIITDYNDANEASIRLQSGSSGSALVIATGDGTTALSIDTNQNVKLPVDGSASDGYYSVGAVADLKLYHDGTDSFINNSTGDLRLINNSIVGVEIDDAGNVAIGPDAAINTNYILTVHADSADLHGVLVNCDNWDHDATRYGLYADVDSSDTTNLTANRNWYVIRGALTSTVPGNASFVSGTQMAFFGGNFRVEPTGTGDLQEATGVEGFITNSSSVAIKVAQGLYGQVTHASGAGNMTSVHGVRGFCNMSATVVTDVCGGEFEVEVNDGASIPTVKGINILFDGDETTGGPLVTNAYGIYLNVIDAGNTWPSTVYGIYMNDNGNITDNQIAGDLYPATDSSYTLGTSSLCWSNIYGDAGVTSCSDRKWKENVVASPFGLDFIKRLDVIEWNFNKDKGETHKRKFHGMLAQDVLTVVEEMGFEYEDFSGVVISGDNYGLRYEQFIAPLILSVQEVDSEVVQLKKRVKELESEVELLRAA